MIKVKAVKAFFGPDGNYRKDETFEVPAARATALEAGGFVERADKSDRAPAKPVKDAKSAE